MQAVVHFQTGIFIQLLCFIYLPVSFAILFTIIFAFLSHFIVDSAAKATYHPPTPQREDKFWITWMYISNGITIAFVVWVIVIGMFWFFFLGGFFSILVDIVDWGILRPIQTKKKKDNKSYWEQGHFFHKFKDKFQDNVPPFTWLPNWNYERKGIVPELVIITTLWILVILLIPLL
jgi:hypothetical protein